MVYRAKLIFIILYSVIKGIKVQPSMSIFPILQATAIYNGTHTMKLKDHYLILASCAST